MQISAHFLLAVVLATLAVPISAQYLKSSPKILSAKRVYFDDQSEVAAVGDKALDRLKKWRRFQITQHRDQADLILLLSADPYNGGYIATAGGQTGTIQKNGSIDTDPVPTFQKAAPVRYAYLTLIDPKTAEKFWGDSREWGGLLTGFNSVGERLIKQFQKQMKNP